MKKLSFLIGIISVLGLMSKNLVAQVCVPAYSSGTSAGDLISQVSIAGTTLNNVTGFSNSQPSYLDFYNSSLPNETTSLAAGGVYTLSISIGSWGYQGIKVWLDLNNNNIFESNEVMGQSATTIGSGYTPGAANDTLNIPLNLSCNVTPGNYRLRIREVWNVNGNLIDPCANYTYGQTHDYRIEVIPQSGCPTASALTSSNISSDMATLSWGAGCGGSMWDLDISTSSTPSSVPSNPGLASLNFNASGLLPNTTYYAHVRTDCGAQQSGWITTSFTTQGLPVSCATGLIATPDPSCDNSNLVFSWNPVAGASNYLLRVGTSPGGSNVLNNFNVGSAVNYTLASLSLNTQYFWSVTPVINGSPATLCSEETYTSGSAGCICQPSYTSGTNAGDLISNVTIVGTSLANDVGIANGQPSFLDFYNSSLANQTATLSAGVTYTTSVSIGSYGSQGVKIWIDFNNNNLFEASEAVAWTQTLLGSGFTPGAVNATGNLTMSIPCTAISGDYRMRVRGVYSVNGPIIDPCSSYAWGQTHDYRVTIAAPSICPSVTSIATTNVGNVSADIAWIMNCGNGTLWDLDLSTSPNPSSTPSNPGIASQPFNAAGLLPSTTYYVHLRTNCGVDQSPWTTASFTTLADAPLCATNLVATPDAQCDNQDLVFSWDAVASATSYTLRIGTTPGASDVINNLNLGNVLSYTYTIPELNTQYFWSITPENNGSIASGCSEENYTTGSNGCICQPIYQQGCTAQDLISNVSLNTLVNNSGTACPSGILGYVDYSNDAALTTTLFNGQSYDLEVTVGQFAQGVAAWIDYNGDGVFDHPTERIGYTTVSSNGASTISFTADMFGLVGDKLLRVRSVWNQDPSTITPCDSYLWGEAEDYTINLTGSNSLCINGSVFCDTDDDGILNNNDVPLANAPFVLNYNGQTFFTNADENGLFFFASQLDTNATSANVTVDAAWLAQNGIQYTNNTLTTTNLVCDVNSPILNFPVNCDSSTVQYSCIMGLVFCDPNNNGVQDSGEVVIPNAPVSLSNGVTIYSDSLGVFSYSGGQIPSGYLALEISSTWLNNNGYALANNSFIVSTNCDSLETVQIGIDCSPVLCANLWTTVTPWIGYYQNQNNTVKINWGNYGPNPTTGYQLTLTFPAGVTPNTNTISNPNYVISGNTITWTMPANSSYFSSFDNISFAVPAGIPSGTPHTYSSSITATGAVVDCDGYNNNGALTMLLGNSYDPNDKTSSQTPIINPEVQDEFIYTIRFQNTGTAPAQDVYILDTLSDNLEWSSLNIINASHYMQLVDLGNGLMKFNFPGIWLPDSTSNEAESHGKVVFSIKEKASNTLNSVIENTAYIYFDWNEPIITNTTYSINAYPSSAGADELPENQISVHPNPTKDKINVVSGNRIDEIQVIDITGKVLFSKTSENLNETIDLGNFTDGIYLLRVKSNGDISTTRIVKK